MLDYLGPIALGIFIVLVVESSIRFNRKLRYWVRYQMHLDENLEREDDAS